MPRQIPHGGKLAAACRARLWCRRARAGSRCTHQPQAVARVGCSRCPCQCVGRQCVDAAAAAGGGASRRLDQRHGAGRVACGRLPMPSTSANCGGDAGRRVPWCGPSPVRQQLPVGRSATHGAEAGGSRMPAPLVPVASQLAAAACVEVPNSCPASAGAAQMLPRSRSSLAGRSCRRRRSPVRRAVRRRPATGRVRRCIATARRAGGRLGQAAAQAARHHAASQAVPLPSAIMPQAVGCCRRCSRWPAVARVDPGGPARMSGNKTPDAPAGRRAASSVRWRFQPQLVE